jgi:hypothetical protein
VRFSRTSLRPRAGQRLLPVDLDDAGTVVDARVVVGESATVGRRVPAAEQALIGAALDPRHDRRGRRGDPGPVEMHGDDGSPAPTTAATSPVSPSGGAWRPAVTPRLPGGAA